jgi:hypothetical protein
MLRAGRRIRKAEAEERAEEIRNGKFRDRQILEIGRAIF